MVRFRRFQNSDPPLLTRLWQQQMPARGRMLGISTAILEGMIFSKTYFDHDGFWVAEDEGKLVGCAHAWPLPDEMGSAVGGVGGKAGTTGLLLVLPHAKQEEIANELLRQTESYLQRQQCSQIFGGNAAPFDQFYLGIYGGCIPAGVLASDELSVRAFEQRGYAEFQRKLLWGRSLEGFRPSIDRVQRNLKNDYEVRIEEGLSPEPSWQPQVWAHVEWNRATLVHRRTDEVVASFGIWDLEPLAKDAMETTLAMIYLQDNPQVRASGMTQFLIAEAMLISQREHATERVEFCAADEDVSLQEVYRKLGMEAYDAGILFRKAAPQ